MFGVICYKSILPSNPQLPSAHPQSSEKAAIDALLLSCRPKTTSACCSVFSRPGCQEDQRSSCEWGSSHSVCRGCATTITELDRHPEEPAETTERELVLGDRSVDQWVNWVTRSLILQYTSKWQRSNHLMLCFTYFYSHSVIINWGSRESVSSIIIIHYYHYSSLVVCGCSYVYPLIMY